MQSNLKPSTLINLLYQNRELLDLFFGKKDSIHQSELFGNEHITEVWLERLKEHNILHDNNSFISLDDRVSKFFDDFLEIGEVHPEFIQTNLQDLKDFVSYYRNDNRKEHLRGIKQSLQKISSTTSREVVKLQKLIDDTYKNESNFLNKKQKLDKYREKRDLILELIQHIETFYEQNRTLLLSADSELLNIVNIMRLGLRKNRDYLNQIQDQIIEYINKIRYHAALYQKIQLLKELKDKLEIEHQTDYQQVIQAENSLWINTQDRPRVRCKVSLSYLFTDEGQKISRKVAEKLQLTRADLRGYATKKSDLATLEKTEIAQKIDVAGLINMFKKTNTDLFSFIQQYQFEKVTMNIAERLSLFVEITLEYEDSLRFSDDFAYFTYTDTTTKVKRKIGYALVYSAMKK
jgi:hypothetical protein